MRVKSNGIGIEGMLIHVHCGACDTWINETAIELTGVGVDDAGHGVLQTVRSAGARRRVIHAGR